MKKKKEATDSRRKFLNKGLFAGAGYLTGLVNVAKTEGKKVKMITADGKLVEVDESLIANNSNKSKVNNREILQWMEEGKSKKDIQ